MGQIVIEMGQIVIEMGQIVTEMGQKMVFVGHFLAIMGQFVALMGRFGIRLDGCFSKFGGKSQMDVGELMGCGMGSIYPARRGGEDGKLGSQQVGK